MKSRVGVSWVGLHKWTAEVFAVIPCNLHLAKTAQGCLFHVCGGHSSASHWTAHVPSVSALGCLAWCGHGRGARPVAEGKCVSQVPAGEGLLSWSAARDLAVPLARKAARRDEGALLSE